ncbi:sialin-like [Coccinella septempunctata]|uniref:sialin-like n=1 Tax=Coccinella septempunctata TaxID=41139 RepID=UPI001D097578|nr:sialin-like [Coccinella septempunctata]
MCRKIPSRAWLAMMLFWGTFVNYMFRSHYQISLLAMMAPRNNETVQDYGPRYDWSYEWEQQSISALFYGLTIISIPAGLFVTFFGPFNVLVWSSVIMAVLSGCVVVMAYYVGPGGVFAMRFFVGVMVGLQYPAMQNLVSNWAPPQEKGKFIACMMGNTFGSVITMPSASMVIEQLGWEWSFYLLSPVVVVFVIAMYLLVADHPRNYRWIRQEELEFIEASHGTSVNTQKKKKNPPYCKMFLSCPFYALIAGQFGNQYILFLALTIVPQYLKRVLGFNLKESAGIAALPQLSRLISGFIFGALNDFLIQRGVPKKYCRKGFTLFSHILTGASLCLFLAIGSSSLAAICLLVMMMAFNGAAVVTVLMNAQDLAPNWSGTLYGIMNFFGGWGGFVAPILVEKLTRENTIGQWAIVFTIGGAIGITTGIIFILFGSTEIQSWNLIEETTEEGGTAK